MSFYSNNLKTAMERQWERRGVLRPLKVAWWSAWQGYRHCAGWLLPDAPRIPEEPDRHADANRPTPQEPQP